MRFFSRKLLGHGILLVVLAALWVPLDVIAQGEKPAATENHQSGKSASDQSTSPSPEQDQRPVPGRKPLRPNAPTKLPAFTPEREAAALHFVSEHHAELKNLLTRLKSADAAAYEQAIRDLFRNSERLAQIKERGESERYDLELDSWKVESRIRLLAARLSMQRENTQLKEQLREALLHRVDLRLTRLELDRRQVAERRDKLSDQIGKLDEQIERARKFRERQADQSFEQLIKSVRKPGGPGNTSSKKPIPVTTDEPAKKTD